MRNVIDRSHLAEPLLRHGYRESVPAPLARGNRMGLSHRRKGREMSLPEMFPTAKAANAVHPAHTTMRMFVACALAMLAANCSSLDRLRNIGEAPRLDAIQNPTTKAGYKPVHMPMPAPQPAVYNPNSLWRSGSRAFFKDQRAHQVGDILTVSVKITDRAQFENETQRSRTNAEDSGVSDFIGAQALSASAKKFLPGRILSADSKASSEGKGSIDRKEELQTNVAAVVTQVLPNGNLVVEGKQEVRVNFEVRELVVAGIVRPEDIQSDNTIDSSKIAEARIAYGGRGQITDVQQPRYGQQVLDILLPF
jgi:flagellar L-ring protein precursor FlgH